MSNYILMYAGTDVTTLFNWVVFKVWFLIGIFSVMNKKNRPEK